MQFNKADLDLKLLMGSSVYANHIPVRPKTLREIVEIGYTEHMSRLRLLCLDRREIVSDEFIEQFDKVPIYAIWQTFGNEDMQEKYIRSLEYFLDLRYSGIDVIDEEKIVLVFNDEVIVDRDTYNEIIYTIKKQNAYTESVDDKLKESTATTDKAKKILEKLHKNKKKVEEIKKKDDTSNATKIDFYSIISSVSTKSSNISKFNIWDLTLYQLYDEFERLQILDSYNTSILAMVQGAKIDDLEHWAKRNTEEI